MNNIYILLVGKPGVGKTILSGKIKKFLEKDYKIVDYGNESSSVKWKELTKLQITSGDFITVEGINNIK